MTTEQWQPYCGAEEVWYTLRTGFGSERRIKNQMPSIHPLKPELVASGWSCTVEIKAICTRAMHPLTEQHVDVERGVSWAEPGSYLTDPFRPSSGS